MGAILKNGVNYTGGGGSGTDDYSELINKPQINGITLSGNKTPETLGLVTKAVDDLVNYYKKTETYTKGEIDTIVTAIKNSRFESVATLPTSDIKTNVIYLVPKAESESGDIKDEYINLDGTTAGWERIGSTDIDLSGYVTTVALNTALANYTTTTDLMALLAGKQDKVQYFALPTPSAELEGKIFEYTGATGGGLTHGYFYECVSDGQDPATYSWVQTNVQPSGGGGGSYTAGDGIDITNDVISTKQSEEGDIDEIIDVYPTAGNLVSIVNAFNKGDIYSTDEKMIGQWIDGKPLYTKTIQVTVPTTQSTPTDVNIGASVDTVVDAKTMFATGNGGFIQTPVVNGTLSGSVRLSVYNNSFATASLQNKIRLEQLSGTAVMGGSSCYVTIQYTKTTDTAISIGEETEYSTDEKVIGTWIDGKPLWQKTIHISSLPNNTTVEYLHNISNLDKVIDIKCIYWNSTQTGFQPFPQISVDDVSSQDGMSVSNTAIYIVTKTDKSSKSAYVTLQYTKTT